MPPNLKRFHQTGNLHFLTFSCYDRLPLLHEPHTRDIAEQELERVRFRYQWTILGYVIMPEHIHLLCDEPALAPLSLTIQRLKQQISLRLKAPSQPRFWLPRSHDFNVFSEVKRIEKLRYIHRNPVTRGLVQFPADYPWSSFRHYANQTPGTVTVQSHLSLPTSKRISATCLHPGAPS